MWVRRWSSQFEIACYFIQHSVNSDAGGCPEWRKFKQLCSKLGTYPQGQRGLSQEFASHETVAVNTAKTLDSPRAGTIPV